MSNQAGPENNWHYNKRLKSKASELRRNPTKAEKKLWHELLRGEGTDYTFMRQRPMLEYIVDFFSKDLRLVIEVDGWTHLLDGQAAYDMHRQKSLEEIGLTVLRFNDDDIMNEFDKVSEQLLGWIALNRVG